MVDKNSIFGGMITTQGAAKKTNCDALGIPWEPRYMLIGDANGTDPVPNPSQTKLVNQVHRAQINQLRVSPTDANVLIAEVVLPPDVGGWWVRELALEDKDGVFSAVANAPPSYKPVLAQGSGRNQVVRMHIITSGTSNIQLKIDPSVVLATRQYVDEAVGGLLPANKPAGTYTKVTVNDRGVFVSGSNPTTLAGYGITDTYTKDQITAMIAQASALPVGSMMSFPVNKVAPGFLELDGSVKSVAAYPDLAMFLGGAFNKGDEGTGNFRLPESRGEFLRGWDHGRGVDAGRAIGSWQEDMFKSHTHRLQYGNQAGGNWGSPGYAALGQNTSNGIEATGGSETRPRNLAVMWCIKAWNAPINQGNIDVAALEAEVRALRKMTLSGYKGLSVSAAGTNALIAIRARSLTIGEGVSARVVEFLDLSVNLATVGLGGLDAGVLAASSWYSTWVATNGDVTAGIAALIPVVTGSTTAGSAVISGIASTAKMYPGVQFSGASFPPGVFIKSVDSPTQITASAPATTTGAAAPLRFVYAPVLPAGYIAKRVNAFPTDATANKYPLCFDQTDGRVTMSPRVGTNVAGNLVMAQGVQGTISGTGVSVSIDPFVPPTASAIEIFISTQSSPGGTVQVGRAGTLLVGIVLSITNEANQFDSAVITLDSVGRSLNFASSINAGVLGCRGYEDSL
ncbi:phage tail protein [Pseudomonas sp. B6002]|uniref:phage tail protein n=1 Tax=Pseudomonas sp. B6002 TaxID=2726978 RepID=UPI00210D1607|nr:phage tail protein [Pseudomonas sp. B6002]